MRILFISLHPLDGYQSWARRSMNMVQALSEAGNHVTLLAPGSVREAMPEHVELKRLFSRRHPLFRLIKFWDALVKASILLLSGKYEAVHFSGNAVCLYALLCRICRVPVVYDVWRSPEDGPEEGGGLLALRERLEKAVLGRIDVITCSCPMLEEEFRLRKVAPKVCLIENAVTASRSLAADLDESQAVIYEHPGRNIEAIAQVLRIMAKLRERVPEARLIICTELNLHSRKIIDLMERLELQGHCSLRPFGDVDEQAGLLASASALLLPEARGGYVDERIIRYMQSGTPVVATRIRSYKQYLDESRAVLTAVGVDDLAEGLARVLQEPLLSSAMAREAQAYAVAHFTRSSFNRKVRAVFNELRR